VPLIDLDRDTVGTTAVWPGTHRTTQRHDSCTYETAVFPGPRAGSVYLMDYRLLHAGTANRSEGPRPILYLIYARPWFTDAENYSRQAKLSMTGARLAAVPELYRPLFLHVQS
jgi:ectoine hydroxylase-related dioxygenase (phytanoyl-CoA dioxygenase family)